MIPTNMATKTAAKPDVEPRGRGRPRPTEVIERDEKVFDTLSDPASIAELAKKTSLERNMVYLSLYRLKRDQRVRRQTTETGATRLWERVS